MMTAVYCYKAQLNLLFSFSMLEGKAFTFKIATTNIHEAHKIIRDLDGEREVKEIDLTSSDVFKNKYFQIQSGDIIIVNPNNARVKNAGIIGNAGTLLSLLSFLLSSIIVINR